jgi:hypothetical protein
MDTVKKKEKGGCGECARMDDVKDDDRCPMLFHCVINAPHDKVLRDFVPRKEQ